MKTTPSISLCSIILLQATLKKYQSERRSKSESIERCQSQLKKLRRKSQGSRHPNKYGDREMQVKETKKPKSTVAGPRWPTTLSVRADSALQRFAIQCILCCVVLCVCVWVGERNRPQLMRLKSNLPQLISQKTSTLVKET